VWGIFLNSYFKKLNFEWGYFRKSACGRGFKEISHYRG
jgi:hypothetical protein